MARYRSNTGKTWVKYGQDIDQILATPWHACPTSGKSLALCRTSHSGHHIANACVSRKVAYAARDYYCSLHLVVAACARSVPDIAKLARTLVPEGRRSPPHARCLSHAAEHRGPLPRYPRSLLATWGLRPPQLSESPLQTEARSA
eukprot:913959-Rhodomonas_salina.3